VAKLFTQSSILALAVVGLCVWFSKATKAQSANELAEVCKKVANKVPSDASDFQRGVCAGQVTALAWVAPDLTGRLRSCSPLEATRLQVRLLWPISTGIQTNFTNHLLALYSSSRRGMALPELTRG
jgi:hypothetical protein